MVGKILHMGKRTHSTLQNSLSFSKTSLSYAISPALLFHLSLSPSSSLASELFSLLLLFSHNLFSANQPENKQGMPAFTPYISPPMPPGCLQSDAWWGSLPTRPGLSSHYFPSLTTLHAHRPSSGLTPALPSVSNALFQTNAWVAHSHSLGLRSLLRGFAETFSREGPHRYSRSQAWICSREDNEETTCSCFF